MIERQELHCHNCDRYVQFDLDLELNGKHVLHCPVCGHEHCRIVKDGIITDERWDSRNDDDSSFIVSPRTISSSTASTYDTYLSTGSTSTALYTSWMNSTVRA